MEKNSIALRAAMRRPRKREQVGRPRRIISEVTEVAELGHHSHGLSSPELANNE